MEGDLEPRESLGSYELWEEAHLKQIILTVFDDTMEFMKLVLFIVPLAMLFLMANCGSEEPSTPQASSQATPQATPQTGTIILCDNIRDIDGGDYCSLEFTGCHNGHKYKIDCPTVGGTCSCLLDDVEVRTFEEKGLCKNERANVIVDDCQWDFITHP